ncbi:unnamed protein product [Rotaria sp. Silwood1]|nr:unnamed protein product [Rotaria sp. Silwood1]CAF1633904.1 unnamed protein product [Rotaria sp. Silwood1]CAF3789007.1 unnamed protein product [Rotaria sp. Silwood1]CAF3815882.1 unnamed protein product [Rotaria sp. Silwood1]CAF4692583.1 unnamed protein product [Rotaria sp. Silwood1]
MFYTLVKFFFYVDSEECFNDSQSTLQDIDSHQQSFNDLYCTTTSSIRDIDIPILSPSSYCLSRFEREDTIKNFLDSQFEQESDFEYFRHSSINNSHHISVYVNGVAIPMRSTYNTTRPYQSRGRSVHWKDEIVQPSKDENYYNQNDSTKQRTPRISLHTSSPYHSKLNIRVNVNRIDADNFYEHNQIKAKVTFERLDPRHDYKHFEALEQAYCQHYLIPSPNECMIKNTRTNIPTQYEILPQHRQISVPASLPVDQRFVLYIREGEVYARC